MKIQSGLIENKEIINIAETLLITWAYEISYKNYTNHSRYDYLLDLFSKADLLNDNLGNLRIYIIKYLIEKNHVKY